MSAGSEYLDRIQAALTEGRRQWRRGDNLLWAFGYVRRRQTAVDLINRELQARGMLASPPITTDMPLDGYISFSLEREPAVPLPQGAPPPVAEPADKEEPVDVESLTKATLTVANLAAAERKPDSVPPDATISEAITKLDLFKYSQLVVMTTPREVKGTVSYRSIARRQLYGRCERVGDCLDDPLPRVQMDTPLLDVVSQFRTHDAVLVFGADRTLSGIVTPADIAAEFGDMAAPFLMIGEVEKLLRWLVQRRIDFKAAIASLGGSTRGIPPESAEDLTLGDIQRMLERPEYWTELQVPYDRSIFCRELNQVRSFRNAVMHFRGRLEEGEIRQIQGFVDMLKRMCSAIA